MDKNSPKLNWKYIAILAFFAGLIFVLVLYFLDSLTGVQTKPLYELILEGLIFSLVYGLLFYLLTEKLVPALARSVKPKLLEEEKIEIESPASRSKGFEKVGGKLFLTNKRLVFKSHKLNIHREQINIEYDQIAEVVKQKISKVSDNGMRISIIKGKNYDFVVQDRDRWLEKLNGKRKVS